MRVLREVGRRGSFSAAADALNFTQSAVSQQIAALEREAGTVLVDRSARGVRLTQAGEALVRHADVILCRLADAEAELEAIAGLRGGRLRMAAFPTAAATLAPMAIKAFRDRHPGVDLSLVAAEPADAIAKLRGGEVEIGLLIDAPWDDSSDDGVERLHLMEDPMYVCLPVGHPMAAKGRLRLEDLREESWMLGTTSSCPDCSIFLRAAEAAGFEPHIAFQSDDYTAIQGFVAAGMGVSVMPDLALVTVREDVVIRAIAPRPPVRRISAGTMRGGYRSPQVDAMLALLQDIARQLSAGRRDLALAV